MRLNNSDIPPDPTAFIDTSRMNQGKRDALEVAESARDQSAGRGFAARMLMGVFDASMITPFPRQSQADREVGDALVRAVKAHLSANLDPEYADATRNIPREVVEGLRELGVFRMKVPREYGGLGLSQVNYNRVLQAIASYCGSTAVLVSAHQSIGVPQPLKMFGTEEQKRKYMPRLAQGALSAFALTETGVGSDPAQMQTIATPSEDGTHYVLNGEKLWTSNGPIAELLVVMAQTPAKIVRGKERRQITAFIVEADWPGVEAVHRCDFMGLRAIQNGVIRFTNVEVPAENVLWGEGLGLKLALRTLNTGRLTLPAACAGASKQCLRIARLWGNQRVQWGSPIGRHEAGLDKIASIAATTFAIDAVTWLTSHWADEGRDIRIEAAMAKLFASEASWRVVDQTLQMRGGRGYERADSLRARGETAWPVERMMRDCRINTIIEGTSDIMRLFLAREALDPHLRKVAPVMRRGAPFGSRVQAALRLLGFYAWWYPARLVGGRFTLRQGRFGPLAGHARYVARTSNRLAAMLFEAMVRNGPALEKRQLLLGALVDVATELFAMAAVCTYARAPLTRDPSEGEPHKLADLFCRQARLRIRDHCRLMQRNTWEVGNHLAGLVLDGDFTWMEQGIIEAERTPHEQPVDDLAAHPRNGAGNGHATPRRHVEVGEGNGSGNGGQKAAPGGRRGRNGGRMGGRFGR